MFKPSKLIWMYKIVGDSVELYSFFNNFFNQFTEHVQQHNGLIHRFLYILSYF